MQNNLLKRIFLVILGQMTLGIGVGFILHANLGVDAVGVLHSGVAKVFNVNFGVAMFYESLITIVIIYFIDKAYINIATITSMFMVGFLADFITLVLSQVLVNDIFLINLLLVLIGSIVLGFGLNIYVLANLGVGALDAIAEIISDKFKLKYQTVKIANDLVFLTVGYLLGGHVGIATIISAIIVGPIIQYLRPFVNKKIKAFLASN